MTVALVVGGVHWAQHDERTDPAEARIADADADADTRVRGAGAPRTREPLYFTPPPATPTPTTTPRPRPRPTPTSSTRSRTATPRSTPTGRTGPRRPTPTRPAKPKGPASPRPLPPSPAKGLTIRYLGIKAVPVIGLRLDSEGRLPAPPEDKPKLVGWYSAGPAPGGPGTAVAVGHRDTRTGPAIFAALEMIKPGRVVEVRRADGRTAVYTVDAVKKYEKSRFPNTVVYGTRNRPELRLITCGGAYDRRKGYESNVVVFAHLTATRGPARTP
ncbi:class F sortase [Streptomyces capitiformicae]|uniref:Sortase family protein n=2 Tax=Streptomyces capitiformicae TaxID=2014920 RepID=A0A919DKH0_9ACTN|nr:class F sortase [Streptomyces capitiformicae]GHE53575.1 hypothetical protein GCM10017771_76010 [Streptomyces capitiformicae]